ncbi:MAG: hypothetical protein IJ773_13790 [Lachnospiraceae bacterium]|nr:hypothetical protein [Lachnospiraceae bacterium]
MKSPAETIKMDRTGSFLAGLTAVLLALALLFYAPAILRNYSSLVPVLGGIAIAVYLLGILFNLKGFDVIIGAALTAFCFGYYLIGRLESINLMQVNLSDINIYFYIDMVLFSAALVFALITAILKKVR